MARNPRIHFPCAFFHVMLRGNGGQDIFFSSEDRTLLCFLLQKGVEANISWLTTDLILRQLSQQAESAHRLYIDFVSQGSTEEQRSQFKHGLLQIPLQEQERDYKRYPLI